MNYPDLKFKSARQITIEEGQTLYGIALENKCDNILEVGTFGGFATLWLAQATKDLIDIEGNVTSVDFGRDIEPTAQDMVNLNHLSENVEFVFVSDAKMLNKVLSDVVANKKMIFIGENHDRTDKIWDAISKKLDDCLIVLHCVECKSATAMKTPSVYKNLAKVHDSHIIETVDDAGFKNSFGIVDYKTSNIVVEKKEPAKRQSKKQQTKKSKEEEK